MDYQQVEIGGLRDIIRRLTVENRRLEERIAELDRQIEMQHTLDSIRQRLVEIGARQEVQRA